MGILDKYIKVVHSGEKGRCPKANEALESVENVYGPQVSFDRFHPCEEAEKVEKSDEKVV